MPGKNQEYGRDYRTLSIAVKPEEHRRYKILAATHGVTIAEVCRLALGDDAMWKRAAEARTK